MRIQRLMVYAVAALLLAASSVFAQDYEIRLTRDAKVGEKYELTASGAMNEHMTVSSQGKILQKNISSFTVKLEGTATVLEVDDLKQAKKLRLLISKCLATVNGNAEEKEVLNKGTQIVAQMRDGKKEFLADGNVVSKDIAKFLGHLISLDTGLVNDDDVFGTKERKKVGDRWAINRVKAAAGLSAKEMKVDPEKVTGSTTVEKLVVVNGIKCLKLSSQVTMSDISLALPLGLAIERSNMTSTFSGEFPVDFSIRQQSEEIAMEMAIEAKGKPTPEAPEITLSMSTERSKSMKWKLL